MKFTPTQRAAFYVIFGTIIFIAFLAFVAFAPINVSLVIGSAFTVMALVMCFFALRERFMENDERQERSEERAERLANEVAELRASLPPSMSPTALDDTCKCGPNASVCHSGMCSKCNKEAKDG